MLHNPHYDLNNDILATGADYWAKLVETQLPARGEGTGPSQCSTVARKFLTSSMNLGHAGSLSRIR